MSNITSAHHSSPDVLVTPAKNYDMLGITYLVNEYNNFMNRTIDPRTKDWFLVDNPLPLICILASYLLFCNKLGPQFMKNRKPFKLTYILLAYNVVQVVVSAIIFHEGLMGGWLFHYNYKCQPVDYSDNPVARRMARAVWYYYMCKLIELLDTGRAYWTPKYTMATAIWTQFPYPWLYFLTDSYYPTPCYSIPVGWVFFVLRKKDNQISFLHLYHHSIMPICAWIGVKWLPGGHGTLLGVINSFIHIIMYGYYLLAALGPQYQKYLWWKKYLTAMQIIQFVIIIAHSAQLYIYDCEYPRTMITILGINTIFIMAMFVAFYVNSYVKKNK